MEDFSFVSARCYAERGDFRIVRGVGDSVKLMEEPDCGMLGFGRTILLIVCLFRVRLEVYFLLCA